MKLLMLLMFAVVVVACAGSASRAHRTSAAPPATRIEPVTEVLHGTAVVDDYRWLEGDNTDLASAGRVTPEVASWTDAQNRYTREVLDNLPGRAELEARLRPLMEVGSVTAPRVRGHRYFLYEARGLSEPGRRVLARGHPGRKPGAHRSRSHRRDRADDGGVVLAFA